MTKEQLKALRPAIDAALKSVGDVHGFELNMGSTTYDPSAGTFSTSIKGKSTRAADGTSIDPNETEYKAHELVLGLKPGSFGKQFTTNGTIFTICGCAPRGKKFTVLAQNESGTVYKFPSNVTHQAT